MVEMEAVYELRCRVPLPATALGDNWELGTGNFP
jgi:hypothetical protein